MATDILIAFIFAAILSILLLATRPDRQGSRMGALIYGLLVLFPVTLAGGLWLVPIGQPLWGSYWLGFLLVALFTALILLASTASPSGTSERPTRQAAHDAEKTENAVMAVGFFVWVLLIASAVAIFLAYVAGGEAPMVDPIARLGG